MKALRENKTKPIRMTDFLTEIINSKLMEWCTSMPEIKQTNLLAKKLSLAIFSCTIEERQRTSKQHRLKEFIIHKLAL